MHLWDEIHRHNIAELARLKEEAAKAKAIARAPQDIQALQAEIETLKARLPPVAPPAATSVSSIASARHPQTMKSRAPLAGWRLYVRRRGDV